MRRTSVLVTLATAAVAVGLAVPALATPDPRHPRPWPISADRDSR